MEVPANPIGRIWLGNRSEYVNEPFVLFTTLTKSSCCHMIPLLREATAALYPINFKTVLTGIIFK